MQGSKPTAICTCKEKPWYFCFAHSCF